MVPNLKTRYVFNVHIVLCKHNYWVAVYVVCAADNNTCNNKSNLCLSVYSLYQIKLNLGLSTAYLTRCNQCFFIKWLKRTPLNLYIFGNAFKTALLSFEIGSVFDEDADPRISSNRYNSCSSQLHFHLENHLNKWYYRPSRTTLPTRAR